MFDVREESMNAEKAEEEGDFYSYGRSPRAQIFKRDHGNVKDLQSMIQLMRSNNYMTDPISACNCTPSYSASYAISARADLNPSSGTCPGLLTRALSNSVLIQSLCQLDNIGPKSWETYMCCSFENNYSNVPKERLAHCIVLVH